ncbi:hypothetical protein [Sphingobacterium sp. UBA5670]|uniref:hypothetical protein n=1 Tax=Sphingobacterium sp. UBA5670 TaxID=1947502 RepID=UPI0025F94ED5|nr:hypothetical protein [Sphingobacterium sp. UBA5670]
MIKKISSKIFYPIFVIGITFFFLIITCAALGLFEYYVEDPKDGYNGINASIASTALIINILTIIIVFITYNNQSEQIKNNKADSDYTRAIDLIYKQHDLIKSKIKSQKLEDLITKFVGNNYEGSYSLEMEHILIKDDFIKDYSRVSHFLVQELKFIFRFLECSKISNDDKKELSSIIPNILNPNLLDSIISFCKKVKKYENESLSPDERSKYLQALVNDCEDLSEYLYL